MQLFGGKRNSSFCGSLGKKREAREPFLLDFIMQGGGASSSSSAAHKRKGDKPGLSEAEVAEIREAFNLFDTDGSGEFCTSLRYFFVGLISAYEGARLTLVAIFSLCLP